MGVSFHAGGEEREVAIAIGPLTLAGTLGLPAGAQGVVLFADGSGSGRSGGRDRYVAQVLRNAGIGTLLVDLLTPEEERIDAHTAHLRFDVRLLANRLLGATAWLAKQPETAALPIGYFGASTGGGAALVVAAERPERVAAVVSHGGRPDLAGEALRWVQAPTLLIVGEADAPVVELNALARRQMPCTVELRIVAGASHLFEEPGALEEVSRLASDWFLSYFKPGVTVC